MRSIIRATTKFGSLVVLGIVLGPIAARGQMMNPPSAGSGSWSGYAPTNPWGGYAPGAGWNVYTPGAPLTGPPPGTSWGGYAPGSAWRGYTPNAPIPEPTPSTVPPPTPPGTVAGGIRPSTPSAPRVVRTAPRLINGVIDPVRGPTPYADGRPRAYYEYGTGRQVPLMKPWLPGAPGGR